MPRLAVADFDRKSNPARTRTFCRGHLGVRMYWRMAILAYITILALSFGVHFMICYFSKNVLNIINYKKNYYKSKVIDSCSLININKNNTI